MVGYCTNQKHSVREDVDTTLVRRLVLVPVCGVGAIDVGLGASLACEGRGETDSAAAIWRRRGMPLM